MGLTAEDNNKVAFFALELLLLFKKLRQKLDKLNGFEA